MDKDYYKIMGVSQDASEKEIKAAYRKLARKYHPDISKEPNAEEQFKEMGEAYEVLKDPAKRAEYNQYLKNREFNQNAYQANNQSHRAQPNQAYHFDSEFLDSIFGHARHQQEPISGHNYEGKINISLEEAFTGTVKQIQVPAENGPEGTMQTLKVKVPVGIKSGQQIRLAGQGAQGINGGPRGDILLTIKVDKHALFDVMDNDIYITLPVTPWEAALGATIIVPTLAGKIDLKIPAGSQGGQKLRIKGRGLSGKTPGDQYVLLKIITPPPTSDEAKALYEKMATVMPFNPRDKMGA